MASRANQSGSMLHRRQAVGALLGGGLAMMGGAPSPARENSHFLSTPETAFAVLPEYGFRPNYIRVDDPQLGALRIHYADEGPKSGQAVILLHGQPTWSYIYRRQIRFLSNQGYRVIAPDLPGFGKSDKPRRIDDHTYARHVQWMSSFLDSLAVETPVLVVHDWGGLIGLPIAAAKPEAFSGLVVLNTSLPDGTDAMTPSYERAWDAWIKLLRTTPKLELGRVIAAQTYRRPADAVLAAYDAPYPSNDLTSGPRALSALVPRHPGDPMADANGIARERLRGWQKPVLIAFSEDSDRVHPGQRALFDDLFPRSSIWKSASIKDAKHFLMEDAPDELNDLLLGFLKVVRKRSQESL